MPSFDRKLRFRLFLLHQRRGHYRDYLKLIATMSEADPAAMSQALLADLLAVVGQSNDYYRPLLSHGADGDWRGLPPETTLRHMPVLTKADIREHFASLHSVGDFPGKYENTSGGSTGHPVVFTQDANYASWSNATHGYYFREFLGTEMNEVRNVWFWGSERDTAQTRPGLFGRGHAGVFFRNQVLLNTFRVTEQQWFEHAEFMNRYRPYYVAGYAGSLYELARVARRHNVRLYSPRFVYSAAETLRDFMRDEIEEQFNAKVFDFYGSREVGAIAGECKAGRLHVFTMNNLVEVRAESDRCTDGQVVERETAEAAQEGRLIVTNLHNFAFPIIRYDIGDTGSLGQGSCPCGSRLPTLAKLTGRVTDHFVRREGGLVHGEYFTHLFYFRSWIESFRVDQLTYDSVRVSVVPNDAVDEREVAEITSKIRQAMGEQCNVEWRCVEEIDRSAQGKHLYTRSYVDST